MLDMTLWQTRLEDGSTGFKQIGTVFDFAVAQKQLKRAPGAFILLGRETPDQNDELDEVDQLVTAEVGIIIATRHDGDASGARNIDQLNLLRGQVDGLMLGWQPEGTLDPVEFGGGSPLGFANQVLWWMDIYRTQYIKSGA